MSPSPVIWCALSVNIQDLFFGDFDDDLEAKDDDDEDKNGTSVISEDNSITEHQDSHELNYPFKPKYWGLSVCVCMCVSVCV